MTKLQSVYLPEVPHTDIQIAQSPLQLEDNCAKLYELVLGSYVDQIERMKHKALYVLPLWVCRTLT